MASIAELIKGLKKLDDQSFRPGDSLIASTVNHPLDALSQLGKWLTKSVNTAAGIPDQYDNPYPLLAPSPEAQSQAAFDVAGMAQLGGMPFAPKSAGGTVGTFIGPKAATWDANKAAAASKLLDDGVDPAQVWREHLIGRMPDGKLFSEISDSGVNFAVRPVDEKYNRMPIGRAINHPDAFNAYPENWETKIQFTDGGEGSFGNDLVKVGVDDAPYPISTTLHELQHAIQQREGWARGGSPEGMNDIWTAARARLNFLEKEPDYLEAVKIDDDLFNKAAFGEIPENQYEQASQKLLTDYPAYAEAQKQLKILQQIPQDSTEAYRRLTGEAQARATQDRLNMNMDERRNNYPLAGGKLSDIPLEQLIYRYGDNGPAMSASDNLNESLLQKYLQQGSLTPDELAQYERNAVAMRDSNRQYLNVANADAQGGTAMDRAGAMGFDMPTFHGTNADIASFDPDMSREHVQYMKGIFTADNPELSANYGDTIYPLLQNNGVTLLDKRAARKAGAEIPTIDSIYDKEKGVHVTTNPSNIRSRFAAFDPLRKDSADLLASKLLPATMLGWGMYNEKKKRSLADLLGAQ